ncbi:hypothetical protein SCHPADRAFT_872957 [Schizopora paradoxa]|uniref:Uncharacterized protein n=1 Tax=Schizopora paradoxa TaxID=27342 RepID=A0A0H2SB91_9AGAM|nr:hypothetical protein SCHPADRAFT_872957 [Schizopora paradoxa]
MTTSQDKNWKAKEQGEEANYILQKDEELLKAIQQKQKENSTSNSSNDEGTNAANQMIKDFEGGFGGQEDLEDRYASTSGEH